MLSQKKIALLFALLLSIDAFAVAILKPGSTFGCGPSVAKENAFAFMPDYGADSFHPEVDAYLSQLGTTGVMSDIASSFELATSVWGLKLSELGSLTLKVRRNLESEANRVGTVMSASVLPHRLHAGFVRFTEGPKLFVGMPEKSSASDLNQLRRTVFYGMGLGVYCAISDRSGPLHLFRYAVLFDERRASNTAIESRVAEAELRRTHIVSEVRREPMGAGARLFAHAFAREMAMRNGQSTAPLDSLMAMDLPKSAGRMLAALSSLNDTERAHILMEWGYRIIDASRAINEMGLKEIEDGLPRIEGEFKQKIDAVKVARPDPEAFSVAMTGLDHYLDILAMRRKEWVAERNQTFDDLIIVGVKTP